MIELIGIGLGFLIITGFYSYRNFNREEEEEENREGYTSFIDLTLTEPDIYYE